MIDFKLFGGFGFRQTDRRTDGQTDERTNERTDIGGCRVAFATEKGQLNFFLVFLNILVWSQYFNAKINLFVKLSKKEQIGLKVYLDKFQDHHILAGGRVGHYNNN